MDPLSVLDPIIREWFEGRFDAPTEAQALGGAAFPEAGYSRSRGMS
jgi:Lhr-like helicase